MATVHVHPLKGSVQNAINYIIDSNKTESIICESKNCNMRCAGIQWNLEKFKGSRKRNTVSDEVVGYHFHQSFAPGSVTKEEAFTITKKWIEKIVGDNYDYVIATHTDKNHIHTHVIVNPYHKNGGENIHIFFKKDLPLFKKLSDEICVEHGLDVLDSQNVKYERTYYEWMMKNKGDSHKDIVRKSIDSVISKVKDYEEFKAYLTKLGFVVEDGTEEYNNRTGLRIKIPNGDKFIRCKRLDSNKDGLGYSLEEIQSRIQNNGVFVTKQEIADFLGSNYSKNQLNQKRNEFFENSFIKTEFKKSEFFKMSSYEKMLHMKKKSVDTMLDEIKKTDFIASNLNKVDDLKDKRKVLQVRINEVTKQLHINEDKLTDITREQIDGLLNVTNEEISKFINERIAPLNEEKKELKQEIMHLSEIINKVEYAKEKHIQER